MKLEISNPETRLNSGESSVMEALRESAPRVGDSRRRVNHIILLGAFAIVLNALFNSFVVDPSKPNHLLKAGDRFPAFSLKAMNGLSVSDKNFAGKPTIYYFFASWCPCAHDTIKWIKRMHFENKTSGLAILGVGILDSPEGLASFATKHKPGFPVVIEEGRSLAHEAGMETTPTTVFVDGGGVIRYVHIGKIYRYEQALEGLGAIIKNEKSTAIPRSNKGAA